MISEDLEFSISQYADATLPAGEMAALEAVLRENAAARAALDEYRKVDELLKAPVELPAIEWGAFAARVSEAVHFEFAIDQYADGSLSPALVAGVEAKLTADPAAKLLLDEHRRLTRLIRMPAPLPAIHWDRLASHMSKAVAEAAEPRALKLFPNFFLRRLGSLAVAACVLLATAFGIRSYLRGNEKSSNVAVNVIPGATVRNEIAAAPIEVQVGGVDEPVAGEPAESVASVSIGAGPEAGADDAPDGIVVRSPRSLIASSAPPEPENSMFMPY